MLAYRTILNLQNNILSLKLPDNFTGKKVEIIILDAKKDDDSETVSDSYIITDDDEPSMSVNVPNDFQKLLLNAPVWNDENFQQFKDIRNSFNHWKI